MHAVNSIEDDIQIKIEYRSDHQIHRVYYKDLPLRVIYWRPAKYLSQGYQCEKCTSEQCWICKANTTEAASYSVPLNWFNWKIEGYRQILFQIEPNEFGCRHSANRLFLEIWGNTIAIIHKSWTWRGSTANFEHALDGWCQIFDDRLEIHQKKTVILYWNRPFHREILTELRKSEPFSKAPVWFK